MAAGGDRRIFRQTRFSHARQTSPIGFGTDSPGDPALLRCKRLARERSPLYVGQTG